MVGTMMGTLSSTDRIVAGVPGAADAKNHLVHSNIEAVLEAEDSGLRWSGNIEQGDRRRGV